MCLLHSSRHVGAERVGSMQSSFEPPASADWCLWGLPTLVFPSSPAFLVRGSPTETPTMGICMSAEQKVRQSPPHTHTHTKPKKHTPPNYHRSPSGRRALQRTGLPTGWTLGTLAPPNSATLLSLVIDGIGVSPPAWLCLETTLLPHGTDHAKRCCQALHTRERWPQKPGSS